jgi:two-component system cell cycle response regulator
VSPLVLIVEDNPINRELVDYLLRAQGFDTLKALDGAVALEMARHERPDLILCDIQMPVMDGIEFARRLKAEPALSRIPLVALTALAMVGDRERILAEGFDGYIAKPIDPATFIDTVRGFLPAAAAEPSAPQTAVAPVPAAQGEAKALILVLDDTPMNLELKRSLLEPHGYEVMTAATADEALNAARRRPPDLILSDVGMLEGSGFDFLRRVKEDDALRDIPFVFLSATYWDESYRETGLRLGAARYLVRPLEPALLLAEIVALLSPRPAR